MDALLVGMRFVQYLAVMILLGSSLFFYYGLRKNAADRGYHIRLAGFVQSVALYACLAALLSAIGWLGCEAVLMSGDANGYRDGTILLTVLNDTQFGETWLWRLVLLTVLPIFLGWRILDRHTPLIWPIPVSGLMLVASLAGIGHGAMGVGFDAWIHLGNQAVHLLAASVWVGGLLSLLYTIRSVRRFTLRVEVLTHALKQFSAIGMAAVILIIASGLLNSWFLVGSMDALLHTTYGQVLIIKVSFVLCMIALALFNRAFIMPRLVPEKSPELLRSLYRSVAAEQIFAMLVIASVSVLGMLPPAMDMHGMAM